MAFRCWRSASFPSASLVSLLSRRSNRGVVVCGISETWHHSWRPNHHLSAALFSSSSASAPPPSHPKKPSRRVRRPRPDVFNITEAAVNQIRSLVQKKGDNNVLGVRIGVLRRGCNGQTYTMNYAEKALPGDEVVQKEGISVFVEGKALMFVAGTTMDYVEDDLRAEFTFDNPNVKGVCGCGESFTT